MPEEQSVNSETATATDTPHSSRELELFTPAELFAPSEQGRARARQLGMPESAGEFSPEQVQSFLKALREFDNISAEEARGYRYDKFPDYAYAGRKAGLLADGVSMMLAKIPFHQNAIRQALDGGKPVSAKALEQYGIPLPKGYKIFGDVAAPKGYKPKILYLLS